MCAALVACNGAKGLLLDIPGDHVEVWIANAPITCDAGSNCPITPPNPIDPSTEGKTYHGQGWMVDATQITTVEVSRGHSLFQLEGTGPNIPAILIVAFADDSGTQPPTSFAVLHNVAVPSSGQLKIAVTMTPAADLATTTGERIVVWRRPSDTSPPNFTACAVVGHARSSLEFFAPMNDTDCDDVAPALECDAFAVHGTKPPSDSQLTCAATQPNGICRLGGKGCVDGLPPTPPVSGDPSSCVPSGTPYCFSQMICASVDNVCPNHDLTCLKMLPTNISSSMIPYIRCTYSTGANCPASQTGTLAVSGPGCRPTCSRIPDPRSVTRSRSRISVSPLDFVDSVMLPSSTPNTIVSVEANPDMPCTLAITRNDLDIIPVATVLVLVDFETDPSPRQHRIMPVVIEPQASGNCTSTTTMTCTAPRAPDAMDTLLRCQ